MTSEFPNANDFTDPIEYAQTFIIEDDDMSSLSMSDLPRFWQEDLTSPEGNFLTVSAGNQMFEKCWWSSRNTFDEDDADEYVWIEKGLNQICSKQGGTYDQKTGWCGKDSVPLFRAQVKASQKYPEENNGYCAKIATPLSGQSVTADSWLTYAEGVGFMTKRAKAEADRKAQELREQMAKQRAEEAKQRETERLNMLKAEHARTKGNANYPENARFEDLQKGISLERIPLLRRIR